MTKAYEYDVALSFAGEDRAYVDEVAHLLRKLGIRTFYDLFEEADLWGKDLYAHLSSIYRDRARFTVMFISKAYGEKLWTNHERMAAQARAFRESQEVILPARFDDTEVPGVLPTTGYVSLRGRAPEELVSLIARKLIKAGGSVPTEITRKSFSQTARHPNVDPTVCAVNVEDDRGDPVKECTVVAQADNGTVIVGRTDAHGICSLQFAIRRSYRLLVAHPSYLSAVVEQFDPEEDVRVTLTVEDHAGSLIVQGTGHIPGLKGRLNPILDNQGRTYLYATNIAINNGSGQPTSFRVNLPFMLEDADGSMFRVTIKHIAANVALLEYRRP